MGIYSLKDPRLFGPSEMRYTVEYVMWCYVRRFGVLRDKMLVSRGKAIRTYWTYHLTCLESAYSERRSRS